MKELRKMVRQSKLAFVVAAYRAGTEIKRISVLSGLSTNKITRALKRANALRINLNPRLAEVEQNGCNGESKRAA
jgi:hypothetical protein